MKHILDSDNTPLSISTVPGATYALKVKPVGTGTVDIQDQDGDLLHPDLDDIALVVRKTFEASGDNIVAVANGPAGDTVHQITLTRLLKS